MRAATDPAGCEELGSAEQCPSLSEPSPLQPREHVDWRGSRRRDASIKNGREHKKEMDLQEQDDSLLVLTLN